MFNNNWNGNNNNWNNGNNGNFNNGFNTSSNQYFNQQRQPINTGYGNNMMQQGYGQPIPVQQNFNNSMMHQQPQMQNNLQPPTFNRIVDKNEIFYKEVLTAILINGLQQSKSSLSNSKGYICTMKGNDFGLTFNLVYDHEFRYLEPFIYPDHEANINNGGTGVLIDDQFMSKATFLLPRISALRDNYGNALTNRTGVIREFMNSVSKFVDEIGLFMSNVINSANHNVNHPLIQSAMFKKYSFAGINVTPAIVNKNGRLSIRFLYSLSEDITIQMKQDQHYFEKQ